MFLLPIPNLLMQVQRAFEHVLCNYRTAQYNKNSIAKGTGTSSLIAPSTCPFCPTKKRNDQVGRELSHWEIFKTTSEP